MGYSLGVDLGTTYTAAAISRGATAEVAFLGDRAPQVPSVVYRPADGPLLLGEAAERHALTEPERIAREFKRRIGDRTDMYLGGTPMTPISLSRAMLNWTIDQVIPGQGELPDLLTVSCPANWHEFRRELMDQVLAVNTDVAAVLCTEPEAAAMHLVASGRLGVGETLAVYDLGGGTFDACVLRRTGPAEFEVGASEGIEHCGGADFDGALLRRMRAEAGLDELDADDPDPAVVASIERLRRDCVEAKEALSVEVAVDIPVAVGSHQRTIRITRQELEELIRPRIEETADCLARALRRASADPSELGAVMLVGGSSRIPLVSEVITERLERPVTVSSQPKLCVAMGAALLGAARDVRSQGSSGTSSGMRPPPSGPAEPAAPIQVSLLPSSTGTAVQPAQPVGSGPSAPNGSSAPPPGAVPQFASPAVDQPPVDSWPAAALAATPQNGRARAGRRLSWHRIASLVLIGAALLMLLVPATKVESAGPVANLNFGDHLATPTAKLPKGATVQPRLLGASWAVPAATLGANGSFDVQNWRVILGGTIRGDLKTAGGAAGTLTVKAEERIWKRLVTVPGVALILGALFSFAYTESLVRGIRRQRRLPSAGEVAGVAGSGAVAGLVVAAAPWFLSAAPLSSAFVLVVGACICAAVGLLAFGWDRA